jgi:predicted ATPase
MSGTSQLIEPVSMIVLTGGPCSGKSSSLAYLTQRLSDQGFMVFVIPETATLISDHGIDRRKMDRPRQVVAFEETILELQLAFEDSYRRAVARIFPERKKVILLDRGIMDIKAFVDNGDFTAMLKSRGMTEAGLHGRYNGVIHLVTAADGAREYYCSENNVARIETPEEALLIDRHIQDSWLGHPRLRVIDNSTGFEGKLRRAFMAIGQFLGMPVPGERKRTFVAKGLREGELLSYQIIDVEEVFLRSPEPGERRRITKRVQGGSSLYFLERQRHPEGNIEEEELITEQQYMKLRSLRDPKTVMLQKEHVCFLWGNQYCRLVRYKGHLEGLLILEVDQAEPAGEPLDLPPFVVIGKEVTGDNRYDERRLAAKKAGRAPELKGKQKM